MAEQNDPAMAEVIALLEAEAANTPQLRLALTFQLSVKSLQFSFPRANAKKQSE